MATATETHADRAAYAVIAGMAGFLGLLTVASGIWGTVALALGAGPVELLARGDLADGAPGRITSATVTSDLLSDGTRALLVTGSALGVLVTGAIYVAVVVFLVMTARGTPFHRFLYPVVLTAGIAMSLGGLLAGGLDGFGRMVAGGELGEPYETAFELAVGPWAFGFVVLVAAYVIRTGHRFQRETEGLV